MQIKTSPYHRKCKYPLCKNILSIYNHEAFCHIHLAPSFLEGRKKRTAGRLEVKAKV